MANNNKTSNKGNNAILSLTKGTVFSYLLTVIVFIVYGILLAYTEVTEKNIQMVVMITTVVSVLIGGFIASKGVNSKGLLFGMIVGLVYAIIMIMISFCVLPVMKITSKMIMIIILSISAGGIGGIIGINTRKN
ncbi:TIGR04086 family membrane protein [uncultured Tyzzerella sp.]|uniref:TIGR04086 family membrane protein n=1 Tax=uncultured Tyzzerella sp. TaxID=2321398 RepID=UPI002942E367|nr:TIGR04086 family membrane protein [uncultured Tyzzerella sp.]